MAKGGRWTGAWEGEVGDMPVAETLRDLRALESRMQSKVCAAERGVESLTQSGGARRDAPGSSG